jgi:hypothetical protein
MNHFNEDLAWSHDQAKLPLWEELYRYAWPDFDHMTYVADDGYRQRTGVDRIVTTSTGAVFMIDEKSRRKYYESRHKKYFKPGAPKFPDILFEFIDNDKRGTPGWAEKPMACDYLAYNILPICQCYLLPMRQTQQAWRKHKPGWLTEFGKLSAPNPGYNTINCPVPVPVVMRAICESMYFRHKWLDEYERHIQHDGDIASLHEGSPDRLDLLFDL